MIDSIENQLKEYYEVLDVYDKKERNYFKFRTSLLSHEEDQAAKRLENLNEKDKIDEYIKIYKTKYGKDNQQNNNAVVTGGRKKRMSSRKKSSKRKVSAKTKRGSRRKSKKVSKGVGKGISKGRKGSKTSKRRTSRRKK